MCRRAAVMLFLVAACTSPTAKPNTPPPASARTALQALVDEAGVPGVAVAVARAGQIVWEEAFGVVDIETRAPATTASRFGIGSITKSLTTAMLGRLVERGKLDFDAPLETWLPDFPHRGKGITPRLVAGHLSGYADTTGNALYWSTKRFPDTRSVLQEIHAEPLAAEPGTRHQYATATYMLLAAAIEHATGKSYLDAMRSELLEPLGLHDTRLNDPLVDDALRTSFHRLENGRTARAPMTDPSHKWAGAGYVATARDVAKFGIAMLGTGCVSEATKQELFRPLATKDGENTGFGLGWRIGKDARGRDPAFTALADAFLP